MTIEELLKLLAETSSTTQKTFILTTALHGENSDMLKNMFRAALHPHILFYRAPSVIPWEVANGEDDLAAHWFGLEQPLSMVSTRDVTVDKEIKALFSDTIAHLTPASAAVLRNIVSKDLRCNVAAKTINNALGMEFIPEDSVQLANKLDEKALRTDKVWWVSPKLDGIRAYYDGTSHWLRSRQGKGFFGFKKIEECCEALVNKFNLSFLDGELISSDAEEFSQTASIVSLTAKTDKHTPEQVMELKDKVLYCLFACGRSGEAAFTNTKDMMICMDEMEDFISKDSPLGISGKIIVLPQKSISNPTLDDVLQRTSDYVAEGFEGSMWRSQAVPYNYKRSNALLKYKFMGEAILTVTGIFAGKGKYEDMAGGIICEGQVPLPLKDSKRSEIYNIKVNVGSGFDDATRAQIDSSWIGREVCIYYQEVSQSEDEVKKGKDGVFSLRFPVFHGFEDVRD